MLISIIVPVYNAQDFLEECVASLTGQTYKNIEILLVDDGSSDNSPEICETLSEADSRIRVFHKENGGAHTARNFGIEQAKGEYVMFIDSDDWFDKSTVQEVANLIIKEDVDVVRFNYVREYVGHSAVKINTILPDIVCVGEECKKICRKAIGLIGEELRHPESLNYLAAVWSSAYRRSIIVDNRIQFKNIREILTFEDGLFNVNFLMYANKFCFIDKPLYHYRKYNLNSITSNYKANYLRHQNVMLGYLKEMVDKIGREDCNEAYKNRIALGTMELCLNAIKSSFSFWVKYKEIQNILNDSLRKEVFKNFELNRLSLKWKLYYFFVKHHMTAFVYAMTLAIRMIQKRG